MTTTIYHNPNCGTSRNVLALIRNSGEEPTVIEYLKTPPTREVLVDLIGRMGISVRDLLRVTGGNVDDGPRGPAGTLSPDPPGSLRNRRVARLDVECVSVIGGTGDDANQVRLRMPRLNPGKIGVVTVQVTGVSVRVCGQQIYVYVIEHK